MGSISTMRGLDIAVRAAVLPPQSILGQASAGAVEAPSDS
jgi:hypothetical protein